MGYETSSTGEFIRRYKTEFNQLKPVKCATIGEKVHFNMVGFKHLIYKGQHRRPTKVIFNRLVLIPLIIPTLKNAAEILETRIRKEVVDGKKVEVMYHALEAKVGRKSVHIRVVVRKIGQKGQFHFFSIMKY
ncbi:MAG TPA: hypothetical protein VLE93_03665 [Candidatus Saccharimonadales bacterium]|nr:hypothetical protein [Candidatus Saccharimonadales bacterium]